MFLKSPHQYSIYALVGESSPWNEPGGGYKPQGIREIEIQDAPPTGLQVARQGEVLRRFTECQKCRISAAPTNGSEQRLVVPQ